MLCFEGKNWVHRNPRSQRSEERACKSARSWAMGSCLHHTKTWHLHSGLHSFTMQGALFGLFPPCRRLGPTVCPFSSALTEQRKGRGVRRCSGVFFLPFLNKMSWEERKQKDYCLQVSCAGLSALPPHLHTDTSPQAGGKERVVPASAGFSEWLVFSGRWVNGDSIQSERIPTPPELICKSPAHSSSRKSPTSSRWGFMTHTESCMDLQHWQRYTAEEN